MIDLLKRMTSLQKIWFITYGDENYNLARRRIIFQAQSLPCHYYLAYTLKDMDEKWLAKNKNFIANNRRGGGYWIWKSQAVWQTMERMADNDILIYADSGCHILADENKKQRFQDYLKMVNDSTTGSLAFTSPHNELSYTKMDTIKAILPDMNDKRQYIATTFFLRKCEHTMKMVKEWVELCQNYHLVDDSLSKTKNDKSFVDHRHDQSIWSLIRKKYGTEVLDDETYPDNGQESFMDDKPIQAKRDRGW